MTRYHIPTRRGLMFLLSICLLAAFVSAASTPLATKLTARYNSGKIWGVKKPLLSTEPSCLLLPRGGSEVSPTEEKEDEEEEEDEDEDEDDDDDGESDKKDITSMEPITVLVKTTMNNKVVDQSVEMMAVRTRNVESLRKALARQLPGKPPIEMIRLMQHGQVLEDELLVDELMEEDEDEDDEEEEETDEDGKPALTLVLDMVPPVDPRYSNELEEHIEEMSTADLLEAYTLNEAAIWFSSQGMVQPEEAKESEEEEDADSTPPTPTTNSPLISFQLRQYANALKNQLEESVFTDKATPLLENPIPPAQAELEESKKPQVRGQRTRAATAPGGPSSSVVGLKQTVQHYLNIDWGDTIRNFCLFLFFGWFGGRTITSRAILLLGAPLCFIVQARPVTLLGKELFYLVLRNPPSIILSLLPAPQQAMLSLSDEDAMRMVYGEDSPLVEEEEEQAVEDEESEEDEEEDDESDDDSDDDSDEYDSDSDYED